jgi:3-methyl-2-oxobutanoate hydroxymethyltransferase
MSSESAPGRAVTTRDFRLRKGKEKLTLVTAYDALFGRLVDQCEVDGVLVGDSLGNVIAGLDSTVSVTLEQMIYHTSLVRRGVKRALLILDMPFLSYQVSVEQALTNGGRAIQEGGAHALKMEGGDERVLRAITALVQTGIPVIGHLGFQPQTVLTQGGHRVQGRDEPGAARMMEEALRLQDAGAFALVLELVPAELAQRITEALSIPTIGIGAGPGCDGQVLVLHDLLGLNDSFSPRFLKRYAALADEVRRAVGEFREDVREGRYPGPEHGF